MFNHMKNQVALDRKGWTGAIRRRLSALVDVRPHERLRVALLALYFFLVITSYYVIKPVRNSLFIQRLGADNLPYVYIATALFVGVLISFYSRFADRITRRALILGTFALLASNLIAFWWVLERGGLLSSAAFYIWAKLYPLLLVSQFWLVTNDFFTTPQAKRVFGLIGTGGIIGGIAGSAIAGALARLVGSERLLLLSAAILGACAGVLILIDRVATPVQSAPPIARREGPPPGAWNVLKESAHLRTIAYILGLTIIVSTIVDWEFAKAVELFVEGEDSKTTLFGVFYMFLNIGSVMFQFLLTSWILRVFGVGIALLLLPLGLLTGSIGIIVHPGLWTASFANGVQGALRYSLDQSTRELLFLPVPADLKYRGKPLIDLAVYRGGTGVAGIILLVATGVFSLGLREMSILASTIVVIWLAVTMVMRREFKASVRRLIRTRDIEARELLVQYLDSRVRSELARSLDADDEELVLYALSLLDGIDDAQIAQRADRLLEHPSDRVRAVTLKVLSEAHARDADGVRHLATVERLLRDPSVAVRSEAVRFICRFGPSPDNEMMGGFLRSVEPELRAAALACVSRHGDLQEASTATADLIGMTRSGNGSERERQAAAEAIGLVAMPGVVHEELIRLMSDPEPEVQRAAMRSAARLRRPEILPYLLARLCCPDLRSPAHSALAAYGSEISGTLAQHLRDESVPIEVRASIPAVFYEFGDQAAVSTLVRLTPRLRPMLVRRSSLKTLGRMRRNYDNLTFEREPLERVVMMELRRGYQAVVDQTVVGSEGLLGQMLAEHEKRALERLTRTLGLLYPQPDILAAYQGLISENEAVRAAGFELLDSTLSIGHRRLVGPLADPGLSTEQRAERGVALMGRVSVEERQAALNRLSAQRDEPWLAAVARAAGGQSTPRRPPAKVRRPFHVHTLPQAGVPYRTLLHNIDDAMMLKLVERAEFLSSVEIFSQVRAEDLAKIAAIAQEREYGDGEILFREGEEGSEMLLVVSGEAQATRRGQRVFVARRGDTLGMLTLIEARPRERTLKAMNRVKVLSISRDDFFDLMKHHFNLAEGVFAHLARLVRKQEEADGPERT